MTHALPKKSFPVLRIIAIQLLAVVCHLHAGAITPVPAAITATPADDNALLTNLVTSTGTLSPAFSSHTFHYGMALPAGISSLSLIATTAGENTTITVNGSPVNSGTLSAALPLQTGATPITVQTTSSDGTTQRSYLIIAVVSATSPASENLQTLTDPSQFLPTPSDFGNFTAVGNRLFFTAESTVCGTELWTSDGTAAGTVMVKDINPGTASIYIYSQVAMGDTLYFVISPDVNIGNTELWKSDGTEAGTIRVRNMRQPEDTQSQITELTVCGGFLYFRYMGNYDHSVLWKTDGSDEGSQPIVDLRPGPPTYDYAFPTRVGSTLYFRSSGNLWKTDGTQGGTLLVKNLPAPPYFFKAAGNMLYFSIPDSGFIQLWKSDGTETGTRMVKAIQPASQWDHYLSLYTDGTNVYFEALGNSSSPEVWKSDGSEEGTKMLRDLIPGASWLRTSGPWERDGAVYFSMTDASYARSVWKTDGTAAGTVRTPEHEGTGIDLYNVLTAADGTSYYNSSRGLWKDDGTEEGLVLVKYFNLEWNGKGPVNRAIVGNTLFFHLLTDTDKYELWKSDGTEAGTERVKVLYSGVSRDRLSNLTALGDTLYFVDSTSGSKLWKSDGTREGTRRLDNIGSGSQESRPPRLTAVDGTLLILDKTYDGAPLRLLKYDGTLGNVQRVRSFDPGDWTKRDLSGVTVMGGKLYFTASDAASGHELWKTDGTEEGTVMVRDIIEGTRSSEPDNLTVVDGILYFSANDGIARKLWKSDGTPAGTVPIGCHPEQRWGDIAWLKEVGGTVYFAPSEGDYHFELWKSDGTSEGTVRIMNRFPGEIHHPLAVGNTLYFQTHQTYDERDPQLWKSDGTEEGTVLVRDFYPQRNPGPIPYLAVLNDTLYFRAGDPDHGVELWKTDGTEEGTTIVKDLNPGTASSSPSDALVMNGAMYFQATDAPHGSELWKTDGTEEGTVMIRDIAGGTGSSAPGKLTSIGTRLYFIATTETNGAQLYLYDTAAELPVVTGAQAHGITRTSAILTAAVTDKGSSPVTDRGILYAPAAFNADPQIGGTDVTHLTSAGGTGVLELQTISLTPGTGYAFRAYATNTQGTAYGPLSAFATPSLDPAQSWRDTYFGNFDNTGSAADNADPDNDGVTNLLERAFRLHPLTPGVTTLIPGIGTSGLPSITTTDGPEGPVLTLQYIRLKASANSGLTYNPQFATDLAASWENFIDSVNLETFETVESIDTSWERVTIQDPNPGPTTRFGRVSVTPTP